jgi:hypothetical protein
VEAVLRRGGIKIEDDVVDVQRAWHVRHLWPTDPNERDRHRPMGDSRGYIIAAMQLPFLVG